MKKSIWLVFVFISTLSLAQTPVDLAGYDKKGGAKVGVDDDVLNIVWPVGENENGKIIINLKKGEPLFSKILMGKGENFTEIAANLNPEFLLTVGKRDLTTASGWNIFFDITGYLPHEAYAVILDKRDAKVISQGSRTKIILSDARAGEFSGTMEITLYNGSPLLNVAAVMSTQRDSVAIVYDGGLVSKEQIWKEIFWSDPENVLQSAKAKAKEASKNIAVKYRTIIGESNGGSIAIFPPPHQYFYPMDNAYNLKYTWYGSNYRDMISGYGIGIRQELMGDLRFVPWFNAPPGTQQRLSFFCVLSTDKDGQVLEKVKKFTHDDAYKPLSGYKTMASHFHTEHVDDVLTHRPLPEIPGHVTALKNLGVNIMHLGEFHLFRGGHEYVNQPPKRLFEYQTMFEECERLSSGDFLMLPGEEPNRFLGGHWMNLFPKPVYWIMSRQPNEPFVEVHPKYGKIYRVSNKEEMLKLLELEKGLAWTAHARTKGSTGFPDKYKDEKFYHSDRFFGAAWKAIPADLSQPRLGKRVLDVMDDMANWGHKKYAIGEADLFRLEPTYEIYGHMNINYLQLDKLPEFKEGWQPVLTAMEKGKFFVSTGEVLLPGGFTVNGKSSGETVKLDNRGKAEIKVEIDWTFPLNFAEIISGDGNRVYRERVNLDKTQAFGKQQFTFPAALKDRKWVRLEVWDVAANGAFTQFVWLE
ncbi:hypothetical protein [Daejeonella sp.]|uniref:hypothetical protein n=1 Tax=Daejeonella sp. TaxID=2805397 RepID=UPI0030C54CF7